MLHFRMDMPLYLMALYGSIMIVFLLLFRACLQNRLPKLVFPLLWSLVLIRLLVPFSLSSPLSAPVPDWPLPLSNTSTVYVSDIAQGTAPTDTSTMESAAYSMTNNTDSSNLGWQPVLITLFGLGAITTAGILLRQKLKYSRRLKNSLLVEHNQTINRILRDRNMGHILVFTNDEIASPLLCGIFHPRIYLPAGMDFQQVQTLQHILAHELMHIKRKDNWLKAVLLVALCLHWYNPLVWFMSKCLSSDLETACDGAVLRQLHGDERKSYAASLLAMAITGNRSTLLYSAFAKTEVERRIRNVLTYKKTTSFVLAISVLFVLTGTVAFATGGQAPFSADLSSYCSSTASRWGVRAELTRDIALGQHADQRADNKIFDVLESDTSKDPDIIASQVKAALAKEFNVEKSAFQLTVNLCLMDEEILQEYANQGITKGEDGFYLYKGESVRTYTDKMLGSVQTRENGAVDLSVHRNRLGQITSVTALKEGDREFDHRTKEIKRSQQEVFYNTSTTQDNASLAEQITVVQAEKGSGFANEQ
ncbi:hypothetical protein Ami103574_04140 [Aminipila butyrica]|uniref:Peptidase M56 domain-containing protein n=1 Tax=Aminipila butyrica TaxID=433296 RepID=A0A858BUE2_9FIRM|nr:M56 family metallopeptidase [Aminipila butyrica]QIB68560.1 hypothetical protein Ami103574_04140 [Aminipila butyrica]